MMSLYSKITHKLRLVSFLSLTVSQLVDMSLLSNQYEWGVTCLYLLTEDVSQHIIIDIMNQDETAVVGENVLLELP